MLGECGEIVLLCASSTASAELPILILSNTMSSNALDGRFAREIEISVSGGAAQPLHWAVMCSPRTRIDASRITSHIGSMRYGIPSFFQSLCRVFEWVVAQKSGVAPWVSEGRGSGVAKRHANWWMLDGCLDLNSARLMAPRAPTGVFLCNVKVSARIESSSDPSEMHCQSGLPCVSTPWAITGAISRLHRMSLFNNGTSGVHVRSATNGTVIPGGRGKKVAR